MALSREDHESAWIWPDCGYEGFDDVSEVWDDNYDVYDEEHCASLHNSGNLTSWDCSNTRTTLCYQPSDNCKYTCTLVSRLKVNVQDVCHFKAKKCT